MALKIKKQFENKVIGFNRSSAPLGRRNDLHILYQIAKDAGRQDYLNMFENATESEVDNAKVEAFEAKQKQKNNAES